MLLPTLALPWLTWNLVIAGYLKLALTEAAIEGSRFAALADQTASGGSARAQRLVNLATRGLAPVNIAWSRSQNASGQKFIEIQIETISPIRVRAAAKAMVEK
jgi:hypothetical protein